MHGYQLMQRIAELSQGIWRPSPGTIYPVLAQLEDEGLVEVTRSQGRKMATLTDEGRALRARATRVPESLAARVADDFGQYQALHRQLSELAERIERSLAR
jgi:DNA-binding PadR family transcriptional regulator